MQYVLHAPDNVLCHTDMHFAIAQISFHLLYIVEIMTYQPMIFIPLTWIACHDNCCHDNTKWPRLWYLSALTFSWLSYRMNINCDNVLHIRIHVLVFKILILLDFYFIHELFLNKTKLHYVLLVCGIFWYMYIHKLVEEDLLLNISIIILCNFFINISFLSKQRSGISELNVFKYVHWPSDLLKN